MHIGIGHTQSIIHRLCQRHVQKLVLCRRLWHAECYLPLTGAVVVHSQHLSTADGGCGVDQPIQPQFTLYPEGVGALINLECVDAAACQGQSLQHLIIVIEFISTQLQISDHPVIGSQWSATGPNIHCWWSCWQPVVVAEVYKFVQVDAGVITVVFTGEQTIMIAGVAALILDGVEKILIADHQ